jgi:electron transfer flavoprotein alpha subunit
LTVADLAADPADFGAAGSPTWVEGLETVAIDRPGRVLAGDCDTAIAALVQELAARGLFAPYHVEAPAPPTPTSVSAVADGAAAIWVVAELFDGAVRRVTLELLAKARRLADERGGLVAAVLLGADVGRHADLLARHGADRVLIADDPRLAHYATEPYAAALTQAIRAGRPTAVLLPSTYVGRDLAPRVAGRLGLGLTGDCIDLTIDAAGRLVQWKPAFGGNVVAPILSRTRPEMATVRPGVLPTASARAHAAVDVERIPLAELPVSRLRVIDRHRDPSAARAAALDEAEIAVGVGLGIGGPEALPTIAALAAALGDAPIATTRDVVDKGWLPRQHQVGITGRAIAPRFYFAIGIRGASEHMVGVRRAGTIVVIDRNPQAPIFAQADLGVVGDWSEVVPRLTTALTQLRTGYE